jgi:surface antigen
VRSVLARSFVLSNQVTNVEVLVAYVDRVLQGKEGAEKLDEQGVQDRLDGSMRLFDFTVDKDVYQVKT